MDTLFRPKGLNELDLEIQRIVKYLSELEPNDENYASTAENLKKLCEAREKRNDRVLSYEAILSAAVSIVGLLVVLNYEKTGIITSKAFSILKLGRN